MDFMERLANGRRDQLSDIHVNAAGRLVIRSANTLVLTEESVSQDEVSAFVDVILDDTSRGELSRSGSALVVRAFGGTGRVRVQAYLSSGVLCLAVRLLYDNIDPDALGIPSDILALAEAESGLLLITGPQRAGKSTTSAAIVQAMNRGQHGRHIVTIDERTEYVHEPVNCLITTIEVGPHRDAPTYAAAVRAALARDTQVIVFGEMRFEPETAKAVIAALQAGVYVIANCHATPAPSGIERLLDAVPIGDRDQARSVVAHDFLAAAGVRLLPSTKGGVVLATELLMGAPNVTQTIRDGDTFLLAPMLDNPPNRSLHSSIDELLMDHRIDPSDARRALSRVGT
jgi:twitching motility protein PilT